MFTRFCLLIAAEGKLLLRNESDLLDSSLLHAVLVREEAAFLNSRTRCIIEKLTVA